MRIARVAAFIGAIGSVVAMFIVGHRNPSAVLMAMFTVWVLSPFVAVVWVDSRSSGWSARMREWLHGFMFAQAVASLIIYAAVALSTMAKPAAPFLMVPLVSWLCIAALALLGMRNASSSVT